VADDAPGSTSGAFAFCDLAGFTAFTAERGDDAAIALVETFGAHVTAGLPADARIVNRIGDGLLVHFESPATAISALLTLTRRCADESTPDVPLWVRSGVHVGTARPLGDDLIGHDVNVAARVGELAGATEVLASAAARAANTDDEVRFDALGPIFLKGLSEPLRVYRATAVESALPTPAAP
jgi:class 3 adenylate cyclase